ncbi:MAG: DMT family transporter [Anderseniella sp.]|jgi:S-adenosylmethionine uptake transporter|nr:DMT family transporter [Anderseniella sp.]
MTSRAVNHNLIGILCVIGGTVALGLQDMLIKLLAEDYPYPLHEIGLVRSLVALVLVFGFLWLEGGFRQLVTNRLGIHMWRGLLLILANMAYFLGLSMMPLADAAAVFFSAPLIITLLAIPFLGEKVGPRRWTAIIIGMLGVLIMLRPGSDAVRLAALLPLLAAICYASIQILTRKLGTTDNASVMAFYVQACFLAFSGVFGLLFGSGWAMPGDGNLALTFLLKAWAWPDTTGILLMGGCGVMVGIGSYLLSQAYRIAQARTVAPFEYTGLPFAVLLGFIVWGELPDGWSFAGILLIALSGVYVFFRETRDSDDLHAEDPNIR